MQTLFRRLREICFDLWYHRAIPGYETLPAPLRWRINLQALSGFLLSTEFVRLLLYLSVWLLAGFCVVWSLDLHGGASVWPITTACVWLYPWVAAARRRRIARLLGGRWPLR